MEQQKENIQEKPDFSKFTLKDLDLMYKVGIRDNDSFAPIIAEEIQRRVNNVEAARESKS